MQDGFLQPVLADDVLLVDPVVPPVVPPPPVAPVAEGPLVATLATELGPPANITAFEKDVCDPDGASLATVVAMAVAAAVVPPPGVDATVAAAWPKATPIVAAGRLATAGAANTADVTEAAALAP